MIIPFGQAAETDKVGKKKQPMELEPCRDAQFFKSNQADR